MFVRTTQYVGLTPDRMRPTIDALAERLLPAMEEKWGCVDGFVLANHPAGRVMGVTLWESEAQMLASRKDADRVARNEINWREEPFVETWELVLDRNDVIKRGHEVREQVATVVAAATEVTA